MKQLTLKINVNYIDIARIETQQLFMYIVNYFHPLNISGRR